MNIYVGNLEFSITGEELRQAFEDFGEVASAAVISDKISGRSKGFGFVEMPVQEEAQAAISGMNGTEMKGRTLNVNEARPRSDDRQGGGGGRRSGFGGDGRRSGGRSRY